MSNQTLHSPPPEKSGADKLEYYLFIGRIEERKGIQILLDAFTRMPDKHLRLAGTGAELDTFRASAPKNVSFLGFLDHSQLAEQLSGCRAVIVASQLYETFGMIIIEAFAAHKPVIAGDIGTIAMLVDDGVTGVKFKYNDSNALIEAIQRFENIEAQMGENGYKRYADAFSPDANYRQLLTVYGVVQCV